MPYVDYDKKNYCNQCDLTYSKAHNTCDFCKQLLRKEARKNPNNRAKYEK